LSLLLAAGRSKPVTNPKSVFTFCLGVLAISVLCGCSQRFMSGFSSGRERAQGEKLFKEGKYQEALNHFNKAIALYPSGPTYTYLGMTYEKMGQYKVAADNLNKAIDKFDSPAEKREEIIKLRRLTGAPTLGIAYGHAASVYLKLNDLELAKSYIKKSIGLEPTEARNFCVNAQIEHALKNDKQAIVEATKSIEIDPHDSEAYLIRSVSELNTGKYRQSLDDCDAAIAINSDDKEAQLIKTKALAHLGKSRAH
jgi:tetratricopeptide (TPR) repeat protein